MSRTPTGEGCWSTAGGVSACRRCPPPQQPDPALVVPDDLEEFAHPGGPIIDDMLGREATVAFKLHHSLASRRPYQTVFQNLLIIFRRISMSETIVRG